MEIGNSKKEEITLNLGSIRLTQEIVDEINYLQTGGMFFEGKGEDSHFDNCTINGELRELEKLSDFLFSLYYQGYFEDSKIIMEHLCHVRNIKNHFEILIAPQTTK